MDVDPAAKPDILQDITEPVPVELHGKFDVVWASHVLEHVGRPDLWQTVRNFVDLLKAGGELWLFVPGLEFACREILAGRDAMAIQALVFGGQRDEYDYHRTGYTLPALVTVVEKFGLKIKQAGVGAFLISTTGHENQRCEQNVVVGVKV